MFANDTNLFYEHKNTIKNFTTVDAELLNINELSLNVGKTKYSLKSR